jgi:hypothetical protein
MARRSSVLVLLALLLAAVFAGCPRMPSGYFVNTTAQIHPQPIESIRHAVLAIGVFEPMVTQEGGVCLDQKAYRKVLTESRIIVQVMDCYGRSNASETGWVYSVTISSYGSEGLREEVIKEMKMLGEEMREAIQRAAPSVKVTVRAMERGYGFWLLPY